MVQTLLIRYFMERKGTVLAYTELSRMPGMSWPAIGAFRFTTMEFQSIFVLCSAIGLLVIILTYVDPTPFAMTDASAAIKKNKTTRP